MTDPDIREPTRSALTALSVVGAAMAGAGVGAYLGADLRPIAFSIFAVGVAAHLVGMVGIRNMLAASGYDPPAWQIATYWLCWAAVAAMVGYGLYRAAS